MCFTGVLSGQRRTGVNRFSRNDFIHFNFRIWVVYRIVVLIFFLSFDDFSRTSLHLKVEPARALAASAAANVSALRASTTAWWSEFWSKSGVSFPTAPALETQWCVIPFSFFTLVFVFFFSYFCESESE